MPLVWLVLWWPVISGAELPYIRDLALYAMPMKTFWLERVLKGALPLWTPYLSAGMPFLADPANQTLYPPNLLFLASTTVEQGLGWFLIAHHLLAMLAFAWLGRVLGVSRGVAVWGGIAYGLSGYVLSISDNVDFFPAVAWVPAALASFRVARTRDSHGFSALAAICLAMIVLAGDPLDALITSAAFGLITMSDMRAGRHSPRRLTALTVPVRHLTVTMGLALLISAAQVLPTLELAAVSVRQTGLPYAEVFSWSFPVARMIELVQPYFFGSNYPTLDFLARDLYPTMGEPWVNSVYLGTIVVCLAIAGVAVTWRTNLVWLTLLLVTLLLSFGANAPYCRFLVEHIPLLATQRYPEKLVFWVTLMCVLFATFGAETLLGHRGALVASLARRSLPVKLALGVAVTVLATWALAYLPARTWIWQYATAALPVWSVRLPSTPGHLQVLAVHTAVVAALLVGLVWVAPAWRKRYLAVLLAIGVADLAWVHYRFVPLMPRGLLSHAPEPDALRHLDASVGEGKYRIYFDVFSPGKDISYAVGELSERIRAQTRPGRDPILEGYTHRYASVFRRDRLQANSGTPYGVHYLNGRASPLQPALNLAFEEYLLAMDPARLMQLASVRYVITAVAPHNAMWDGGRFRTLHTDRARNLRILEVEHPLPAASLVPHARAAGPSPRETLSAIASLDDVASTIVLAEGGRPERSTAASPETVAPLVRVSRPSPERIELEGRSPFEHAYLLVDESYDPGWSATLDGNPVELLRADLRFMAIPVPRGPFAATLRYHQPALLPGALLSALGLLLCAYLLLAVRGPARSPPRRVASPR